MSSKRIGYGSGLSVDLGPPPADADEEESPVAEEFGWFAFEGVADELENPSDREESQGVEPQVMKEEASGEDCDREQDRWYAESVAEAIDRMLVAGRVLRDPLLAGAVAKHAEKIIHRRVALVLAAAGIYGVLSGSVTERMREIGVRVAVGATRGDILTLIIRQGMALTAIGIGIGLSGAVVASHALVSLLFGISRLDPATYFAVVALLAVVSIVACGVPAWRAAQIDPASTLRAE